MTNGVPDSHSHVTTIQDDGAGTVTINVQFAGFLAGTNVEVSGYLAQVSGSYVPFSVTRPVDPPADNSKVSTMALQVDVTNLKKLDDGDVIVVTRIAETWPTVLERPEEEIGHSSRGTGQPPNKGPRSWKAKGYWGDGPPTPLPTVM